MNLSLDAVVTNPVLRNARELRVMSKACLVGTVVGTVANDKHVIHL